MLGILVSAVLAAWQPQASYGVGAPSPVAAQPLANGEVLLEVNGLGTATAEADTADLNLVVRGRGATSAEAKAAYDAAYNRLLQMARAAGIDPTALHRSFYAETPDLSDAASGGMREAPASQPLAPTRMMATGTYSLQLHDMARAQRLSTDLAPVENVNASISYSISDDSPARAVARRDALTKARATADGYAAALNLRVVRMVRVTERTGINLADMFGMAAGMESRMRSMRDSSNRQVSTISSVGVDYVLGPR